MSLREHEQQRLLRMNSAIEGDCVLTFRQWCEVNGFSERTGRRILKAPGGPVVMHLTSRKIGITVANNRAWQASKARA
jgi:hypothetical protein